MTTLLLVVRAGKSYGCFDLNQWVELNFKRVLAKSSVISLYDGFVQTPAHRAPCIRFNIINLFAFVITPYFNFA